MFAHGRPCCFRSADGLTPAAAARGKDYPIRTLITSGTKNGAPHRDFKPGFGSLDLEGLECRDAAGGILAFGMAVGLAPLIFAEDSDVNAPLHIIENAGDHHSSLTEAIDRYLKVVVEDRGSSRR